MMTLDEITILEARQDAGHKIACAILEYRSAVGDWPITQERIDHAVRLAACAISLTSEDQAAITNDMIEVFNVNKNLQEA